MNLIKKFVGKGKQKNKTFNIYLDEDAESPRNWDNIGKLICFHKRYDIGDENDLKSEQFGSWDELKHHLIKECNAVVILPVYLYDHSGLRIKVGSFSGLLPQGHAEFDSGQVGFIYIDKETLKDNKLTEEKAIEILKGEIEDLDKYLSGDIYKFELLQKKVCKTCGHIEEEFTDGCGGIFGFDEKKIFKEAGLNIKDFSEVQI